MWYTINFIKKINCNRLIIFKNENRFIMDESIVAYNEIKAPNFFP